jgi:CheY-like chemotaxis protein
MTGVMANVPLLLLIEDDLQMRRFLRTALTARPFRLIEATTVAEATLMATSHNPELVLLDLGLPDGDGIELTRTLRDNFQHICHFHVAGVPSRQEIDDKQEVNFRFIANAIADLGYTGFIAHEWRPGMGNDPVKSLERCFEILNV